METCKHSGDSLSVIVESFIEVKKEIVGFEIIYSVSIEILDQEIRLRTDTLKKVLKALNHLLRDKTLDRILKDRLKNKVIPISQYKILRKKE